MVLKLYDYIGIGIAVTTLLFGVYYAGSFDTDFKTNWELFYLGQYFKQQNLTLIDKNIMNIKGGWYSNLNLTGYHNAIKQNYVYNNKQDCKYWALNWALYFKKHNIDFQFVQTDEHIFVIAEYKDKYCIADNDLLECFYYGI